MAELIEFVGEEPLVPEDLTVPARLDADVAATLAQTLANVIIPGMRRAAEGRTSSAIRKGRYRDTFARPPAGSFPLDVGQAYAIESITIGGVPVDPASYGLRVIDRDRVVDPPAEGWAGTGQMVVTYLAGIDVEKEPSVKAWLVMACTWAIDNPSLYVAGETAVEPPGGFVQSLLAPICAPPRV